MPTKYIRNQSRFIVFHEKIVHKQMAVRALGPDKLIHGAGFVKFFVLGDKIQVKCYGHSESLNKKVRSDDHQHILHAMAVENKKEVAPAKYIIWRGKAVIFSNDLEHKAILQAAFLGTSDCESAGFIKFVYMDDGTIDIQCSGDVESVGASAQKDDYKTIAELLEIPESSLYVTIR